MVLANFTLLGVVLGAGFARPQNHASGGVEGPKTPPHLPKIVKWIAAKRNLALARHILLALVLILLAACGGSGYSQSIQTGSYSVRLALDGTNFDEHTATIELSDKAGQPVEGAQVVVAPLMESMGMAAPEQAAQPLGSGRYQAKGAFFSMIGEWEFDVRVSAGGQPEEIARFKVPVQQ